MSGIADNSVVLVKNKLFIIIGSVPLACRQEFRVKVYSSV